MYIDVAAIYYNESFTGLFKTPETDIQTIANEATGQFPDLGMPDELIVTQLPDTDIWRTPTVRIFKNGEDYFERVETLDEVAETIKGWIDNVDDEYVLLNILKQVTGIEEAKNVSPNQIGYNIP